LFEISFKRRFSEVFNLNIRLSTSWIQGITKGGKGVTTPRAPNYYGGAESLRGCRMTTGGVKKSQQCQQCTFFNTVHLVQNAPTMYFLQYKNAQQCTFFNTVHVFPKDLRFEHGGAKLDSCPGRHLTSLRPWLKCHNNRRQKSYYQYICSRFQLQTCVKTQAAGGCTRAVILGLRMSITVKQRRTEPRDHVFWQKRYSDLQVCQSLCRWCGL